ncbi:MAG: TonB-dependent receptor [Steroidobacteraceae bacterium]
MYRYKFTNLQLDFFNSPVFAFSTINAGSAITKGVELEFEYAPHALDGFNLRGSLNYNKARYGNVPDAPCFTGMTIAEGCIIPGPGQRPRQSLKGKPTANAPLWTASLGVSYETPVTSSLVLGVATDARYSDDYIPTAFGNPVSRQDSYVNLDASVRLKTEDEQWELAVIGKEPDEPLLCDGQHRRAEHGQRHGHGGRRAGRPGRLHHLAAHGAAAADLALSLSARRGPARDAGPRQFDSIRDGPRRAGGGVGGGGESVMKNVTYLVSGTVAAALVAALGLAAVNARSTAEAALRVVPAAKRRRASRCRSGRRANTRRRCIRPPRRTCAALGRHASAHAQFGRCVLGRQRARDTRRRVPFSRAARPSWRPRVCTRSSGGPSISSRSRITRNTWGSMPA